VVLLDVVVEVPRSFVHVAAAELAHVGWHLGAWMTTRVPALMKSLIDKRLT